MHTATLSELNEREVYLDAMCPFCLGEGTLDTDDFDTWERLAEFFDLDENIDYLNTLNSGDLVELHYTYPLEFKYGTEGTLTFWNGTTLALTNAKGDLFWPDPVYVVEPSFWREKLLPDNVVEDGTCLVCGGEGYQDIMWNTLWEYEPFSSDDLEYNQMYIALHHGNFGLHQDTNGDYWVALHGCGWDASAELAWLFLDVQGYIPQHIIEMVTPGATVFLNDHAKQMLAKEMVTVIDTMPNRYNRSAWEKLV